MFPLAHERCTQALDLLISEERIRYASERVDFHVYFNSETVAQIQSVLRGPECPRRMIFVGLLLRAQKDSPHALWAMLLVQAFEPTLLARRRAIGDPGPLVDDLVIEAFVAALKEIPVYLKGADIRDHVLETSRAALDEALTSVHIAPRARPSGVRLVSPNPSPVSSLA